MNTEDQDQEWMNMAHYIIEFELIGYEGEDEDLEGYKNFLDEWFYEQSELYMNNLIIEEYKVELFYKVLCRRGFYHMKPN